MHQDVQTIIEEYWLEMTILDELLKSFRKKFHYLEAVRFDTLDDISKFACFLNLQLEDVHLIQFLGLSECTCNCNRDCFLWVFTTAVFTDHVMTMGNVLTFIEESDMVCEHEKVAGFVVGDDTIHVLVKRSPQEVNEPREAVPVVETESEGQDDQDIRD